MGEKKETFFLFCCLARFLFYYFFMLCDLIGAPTKTFSMHSDWFFILVNSLFSITNGYFGSLGMMFAPKVFAVKNKGLFSEAQIESAQKRIGPIMVICLTSGLMFGAFFSYAVKVFMVSVPEKEFLVSQIKDVLGL